MSARLISARFASRCSACGRAVNPGDRVAWIPGERAVKHAACSDIGSTIVTAVEASRAVAVEPEFSGTLPVPEGKSYLPYQRAGIAYAMSRSGTLIADEMGLGKTVQAIGIVNASPDVQTVCIVCPASLKVNWLRECQRWLARDGRVTVVNGKVSTYTIGKGEGVHVTIVNYDILRKLGDQSFDLLVADEAHYAKNPKAARTKALQALATRCKRSVLLTGTPILNKPIELWPLLQIVAANVWDPAGTVKGKAVGAGEGAGFFRFATRYCNAHKETVARGKTVWVFDGNSNLDELQERLRSTCMIRRLKSDVLTDLPPKRRQVIELPCDESWDEPDVADELDDARAQLARVAFEDISRVRHAQALAKLPAVVDHVRELLEGVAKVVLFAHHHDVIDGLMSALSDMNPVSLTGREDTDARQRSVDRFMNDASCRLFIGSLKAAGVGLTLTVASTVVFAELDWTPATLTQAEDRCHRIGQRESVLVQHLVLANTLDAKMARMVIEKQDIADAALDNTASYTNDGRADVESREAREARRLKDVGLTSVDVERIHAKLRYLASRCDGAVTEDGCGFNKLDSNFGKTLARLDVLSSGQAIAAYKMLQKYKRQLEES